MNLKSDILEQALTLSMDVFSSPTAQLCVELVVSLLTLVGIYLCGRMKTSGWVVLLWAQAAWWVYVIFYGAYGLVPLNVGLTILYAWNSIKWKDRGRTFK